ncbi:TATA box binding protein associated factor-domain-containing protein [Phakopsora pachyrhizi]|uniref:TBP-associated factor 6 n=1 Tax=Phakopsora pachyrhizi TaxID=170000 RepID=A0AAV0BB97_PHAPC|nr:TATA box binding protein associated factor-domain-containing protein [Phakopsora pachyrhizi]CAH7683465.1 TATA box binding protein associated factor-domain-containing protein [Phakopsora pachyrhizi]
MPVIPIATGVWPKTSVRDVAESLGLSNLSDEAASALAADVEFRLNQIIEESLKFMRHSKRTILLVEDVDYALRAKNVEPLWGFASTDTLSFRRTTSAVGNLYSIDDEEIDLTKIVNAKLPPVPREISYTAHWLAVEGVQPAIPQNPSKEELKSHPAFSSTHQSPSVSDSKPSTNPTHPTTQQYLSRELRLYFDRVTTAAFSNASGAKNAALASLSGDPGLHQLVPYLIQFVSEKVTNIVTQPQLNFTELRDTVQILESVLSNPHSYLEPYLHQILPCILTCLLFASSSAITPLEREIRYTSGSLLSAQLVRYQQLYPTLRTRILKTLTRALISTNGTEGNRLGALIGLKLLGKEVTSIVLGQNLKAFGECLESDIVAGKLSEDSASEVVEESLKTMSELYYKDQMLLFSKRKKKSLMIPPQDELESQVGVLFAAKLMSTSEEDQSKLAYAFIKRSMENEGDISESEDGGDDEGDQRDEDKETDRAVEVEPTQESGRVKEVVEMELVDDSATISKNEEAVEERKDADGDQQMAIAESENLKVQGSDGNS